MLILDKSTSVPWKVWYCQAYNSIWPVLFSITSNIVPDYNKRKGKRKKKGGGDDDKIEFMYIRQSLQLFLNSKLKMFLLISVIFYMLDS